LKRIFVAGHSGMVGASIIKRLSKSKNLVITKSSQDLNLLNQDKTLNFFKKNNFDEVYLCAAKVGGIFANSQYPADFIYENLMIQNNVINSSYVSGVKKLLFLGSSCIYPRDAAQPISEEGLLNGYLEKTNEPYAVAKIAGIKMCESYNKQFGTDFRSVMPSNLYGPGDNYHSEDSHVIPALIRRFHEAKIKNSSKVIVWGSGKPLREFLYVEDMADACIKIMNLSKERIREITSETFSHINIGSGEDISIEELSGIISSTIGFKGKIEWDRTKPDGTPRKLLNIKKLKKIGWKPRTSLEQGLIETYKCFVEELPTDKAIFD